MASSAGTITLTFRLTNRTSARALTRSYMLVSEIAAEQSWNEEAKEARRLLRKAIRGLVPKQSREK